MDWGGPTFVILIIAICTIGSIVNNWIRARHGYELEDEWGGKSPRPDNGENKRLKEENRELNDKLDKMQDRMIVLEKIVTDRGYSLADEIEALRDAPSRDVPTTGRTGNGVPLNLDRKEKA